MHRGTSVYHLDASSLARLKPDLILTQELCAVCAPSYTLVRQAARLLDAETRIVSLEPRGLLDVLDNILLVGELAGAERAAAAVVARLRARIGAIEGQLAGCFCVPTVFFYPGERTGKTKLKFLGFYPEDGNYRSVHVGG